MALQNSGSISFADLASEFGAPNSNIKMSDFKRQSGKDYEAHQNTTTYPYPVPQTTANNNISDSTSNTATRSLSNYYGGKADNNAVTLTTPNTTWNRTFFKTDYQEMVICPYHKMYYTAGWTQHSQSGSHIGAGTISAPTFVVGVWMTGGTIATPSNSNANGYTNVTPTINTGTNSSYAQGADLGDDCQIRFATNVVGSDGTTSIHGNEWLPVYLTGIAWRYDVTNNKTEVSIRFIGNNTLRFAPNVYYTLGTFGSTYCYYQHSNSIGQNGTGAYMADSQRSNAINTFGNGLAGRSIYWTDAGGTQRSKSLSQFFFANENATSYQYSTSSPNYISAGSDYAGAVFPAFHWTANRDTSIDRPSPVNTTFTVAQHVKAHNNIANSGKYGRFCMSGSLEYANQSTGNHLPATSSNPNVYFA